MDEDIVDDLEAQKALIEEEIRKRRRANTKARKEEEDRALIAAAEGRVKSDIAHDGHSYLDRTEKGQGKGKKRCRSV